LERNLSLFTCLYFVQRLLGYEGVEIMNSEGKKKIKEETQKGI